MIGLAIFLFIIIIFIWNSSIIFSGIGILGAAGALICNFRSYNETYKKSKTGYKTEKKILHILNCLVSKGQFIEINSTQKLPEKLEFFYKQDMFKKGIDYKNPGTRRDYICKNIDTEKLNFSGHFTLDGYNDTLGIAFEYNGPLHYIQYRDDVNSCEDIVNAMHEIEKDIVKEQLLRDNNIKFIKIHYKVTNDMLYDYIASRLADMEVIRTGVKYKYIPEIDEPPIDRLEHLTELFDIVDNPNLSHDEKQQLKKDKINNIKQKYGI